MNKRKLIERSIKNGKLDNFGTSCQCRTLFNLISLHTKFNNSPFYITTLSIKSGDTKKHIVLHIPSENATFCYTTRRKFSNEKL